MGSIVMRFHASAFAMLAAAMLAAVGADAAEKFERGQPIVVEAQGGYHRGTVEKVSTERGCTRVDYRWSTQHIHGSGYTYPGCTRTQKIYTLEQAKQQKLPVSEADEGAAPKSATELETQAPTQSSGRSVSSVGMQEPTPHESQVSAEQRRQLLHAHNRWREKVDVPPLEWSDAVAATAQAWADRLAKLGRLEHDPGTKYGENLFIGSGSRAPADAVDDWGSEKARCGYHGEPISSSRRCAVAHYTQMVWRNTERVGCGVAHARVRRGATIWVCRYDPPGNFVGEKPY